MTAREQAAAIVREGQRTDPVRVMQQRLAQRLPGGQVPQDDAGIAAAGGQQRLCRMEGRRQHPVLMSVQYLAGNRLCRQIPQAGRAIAAG